MNDSHDNAAGDSAMLRKITTDFAVEAFRKTEQKRYQLELAEHALGKALSGNIDMDRYFAATEEIRAKYENDRIVAAGRNALPRN